MTTGLELTFENISDWSEPDDDAGEDPDSNSEGFFANDYPEVCNDFSLKSKVSLDECHV